ncbi:MAG: hypothetical protein KatS3mg028_0621 [Bacteroidia bacterium]|nr:MAG: hypothetical protein KatS3mg028_0621 [Bacteroidia bacterium]
MVFASITFLLYFLPLFFLIYQLVPQSFKNAVILAGSILFYSWGGPKFIFAILITTFFGFCFCAKNVCCSVAAPEKNMADTFFNHEFGNVVLFQVCQFFRGKFVVCFGNGDAVAQSAFAHRHFFLYF